MAASTSPASLAALKFLEQLAAWGAAEDLTGADVLEILRRAGAPECPSERVGCLRAHIGWWITVRRRAVEYEARQAKRPKHRDPAERIAVAVAELLRTIPREIKHLRLEASLLPDDLARPLELEMSRLRRLQTAALAEPQYQRPAEQEAHPRIADPAVLYHLLHTYELVFGQATISRYSPAIRFIALAIERIGWDSKTREAIAQALRRERIRRRSSAPNS